MDGGGALMNQGIHGVDLLLFLVGDCRVLRGNVKTMHHNIETEDAATAILEFDNGAMGVIEASTCTYPGFERRVEIMGERGYVILREGSIDELMLDGERLVYSPKPDVSDKSVKKTSSTPSAVALDGHKAQIANMVAAIKGEATLSVSAEDGARAVRLIRDIYRSSREHSEKR